MEYYAHTPPKGSDDWQTMEDHLRGVADNAESAAAYFGHAPFARLLGLTHDMGKYSDDFQVYLHDCEQAKGSGAAVPMPGRADHRSAGAHYLASLSAVLGLVNFGHHGGLLNLQTFKERRDMWQAGIFPEDKFQAEDLAQSIARFEAEMGIDYQQSLLQAQNVKVKPGNELTPRFLLSCLVDADRVDTQVHFNPGGKPQPRVKLDLSQAMSRLLASQAEKESPGGPAKNPKVQQVRSEIYQDCLKAAAGKPGVYRLAAPTGGGKTRSSLAFGLRHALANKLRRVIYAIPYTSIIDQTAAEFRRIMGDYAPILEHHSDIPVVPHGTKHARHEAWRLAAAEDWDAPLIVTTTVQLFESLLASHASRCRKLHRIAGSVIILDEVQCLPIKHINTIVDVLKSLVQAYGVSVVLCTATHPDLTRKNKYFQGFPEAVDIVANAAAHFQLLQRVDYEIREDIWDWKRLAAEMSTGSQAMAVVNLRQHAAELYAHLPEEGRFYLSSFLCPLHRRAVIDEIRQRLTSGLPCRVASTQLIEAGVDIDFARLYRAWGPLDRIVQSAGRCNREGKGWETGTLGKVVIFTPEDHRVPSGEYRLATQISESQVKAWVKSGADITQVLHNPDIFADYYGKLQARVSQIKPKPGDYNVAEGRKHHEYELVGKHFRLVEQETKPVIVPHDQKIYTAVLALIEAQKMTREGWRRAQQLIVNLYSDDIKQGISRGFIEETAIEDLYVWVDLNAYDAKTGIAAYLSKNGEEAQGLEVQPVETPAAC